MNREAIQERNYQQYCDIGYYGEFAVVDSPCGLMFLIELIALKLAERTKLKV